MSGYRGDSAQGQDGSRSTALKQKLAEIEAIIQHEGEEPAVEEAVADAKRPVITGTSERAVVRFPDRREILVTVGTSKDAQLVERIAEIVYKAYTAAGKSKSVDCDDAMDRLEMGDDGVRANRVLHLAWIGDQLAGCASSTFSPGWTPEGCGHWGLLAVDPALQGKGVGTALIMAAERRLATVSQAIQIEYRHTQGDAFSKRLLEWYEDTLGFDGGPKPTQPGQSSFRRCFKEISADEQNKGHRRRLREIHAWLSQQLSEEVTPATTT